MVTNCVAERQPRQRNVHVYVILVPLMLMMFLVVSGWMAPGAHAAAKPMDNKRTGQKQIESTAPPQQRTCRDLSLQMNYTPTAVNISFTASQDNLDPPDKKNKGWWETIHDGIIALQGFSFSFEMTQNGGLSIKGSSTTKHTTGASCNGAK